jgi:hypothetical protein
VAAVAYDRWRRSVKLLDGEKVTDVELPVANPKEAQTAKDLLAAIVTAFEEAEESTRKHVFKELKPTDRRYKALNSLNSTYQATVEKRQKGTEAWKKLRWVVHDKQVLATLTERVSNLSGEVQIVANPPSQVEDYVEHLVRLFPGAAMETQRMMATLELEELVPTGSPDERVRLVEVSNVSAKVDRIMQQVAVENIKRVDERHRFLQNIASDGVRAAYGDAYGRGAQLRLNGPGSVFQGNVATGHGTRASYGDRVNMPDPLASASDSD